MSDTWRWKKVGSGHWLAVDTCKRCGQEFNSGNVAASKYCAACAEIVRRERTRERVRRFREKNTVEGK